jgi:hypothetical protein
VDLSPLTSCLRRAGALGLTVAVTLALLAAAPAPARAAREATEPVPSQVDTASALLASAAIGLLVFGTIGLSMFGDRRHSRRRR